MRALVIAAFLLSLTGSPAQAQVDLGFPKVPRHQVIVPGGLVTGAALYAPKGAGPFPAIVLSHTCGGLYGHVLEWASRAVEAGFVALAIDHFGPRGLKRNCWPDFKVSYTVMAQDAAAAMKHLRTLKFVDGKRIVLMGFSMGAMVTLRAASPTFRKMHLGDVHFAAGIAFYPFCGNSLGPDGKLEVNFYHDTDVPLLVLLGEKDDETPPAVCVQQAKRNADEGRPVTWKVYPDTTHAFDGGSRIRHAGGKTFHYRHNAKSVEAAWRDSREFLARHLGAK